MRRTPHSLTNGGIGSSLRKKADIVVQVHSRESEEPEFTAQSRAWGEATTAEMCIGLIMLAKKDQDLTKDGENDDLAKLIKESGGTPVLDERATKP